MNDNKINEILDNLLGLNDGKRNQEIQEVIDVRKIGFMGKPRPILFLDIDKVLNGPHTRNLTSGIEKFQNKSGVIISKQKLSIIKKIYLKTNCRIVIVSPLRRDSRNLTFFNELFTGEFGITIDGYSPVLGAKPSDEMIDWFGRFTNDDEPKKYCIVSSDYNYCLDDHHFFQTSETGIYPTDEKKIIGILNR